MKKTKYKKVTKETLENNFFGYRLLSQSIQDSSTLDEDTNLTCTMVNLNIVASKYNIDPATVCMCVSPPCKLNEKILIGK